MKVRVKGYAYEISIEKIGESYAICIGTFSRNLYNKSIRNTAIAS